MRKYQLLFVYFGFISVCYAGSQLTEDECNSQYTPGETYWYFQPASDPHTAIGAQCNLMDLSDDCPDGRHHRCCLGIGGLRKTPDTNYFGGISRLAKGWLFYEYYSTKADLFRALNSGGLRKAYENCMND